MKHRSVQMVLLLLAAAHILTACGGGGGGGSAPPPAPTVRLTGNLATGGNGYTYKTFMAAGHVGRVIGVPVMNGSLGGWSLSSSATSSIAGDGSFAMTLDGTFDYVPVLVDSSVTGTGRYVGLIGANAGSSESILNIPVTQSILNTIALGTVSRPTTTTYDAISSRTIGTTDFSLSAAQLATLAKTDDIYKNIMNVVNNYGNFGNAANVWYYLRPNFSWRRTYSGLTNTNNLVSQPVYTYMRYQFQLTTNSPSINMNMLCTTPTITLQLYPPAGSNVMSGPSNSYNDSNPIQNEKDPSCRPAGNGVLGAREQIETAPTFTNPAPADFLATDAYNGDGYTTMDYEFMTDLQGNIPPGYWTWKEYEAGNGMVVKGMFDASVSIPKTAAGNPKGFVPALRVNTDSATPPNILSVDIEWFYYDEVSGLYIILPPADRGILKRVMMQAELEVLNESLQQEGKTAFDPTVTTRIPVTSLTGRTSWQFDIGQPNAVNVASSIILFYETAGIGNYFEAYGLNSPGGGSGKPRRKAR